MKKIKISILVLFCVLIGSTNFLVGCKNNKAQVTQNSRKDEQKIKEEKYSKFSGLNLSKTDIKLKYKGEILNLKLPIYMDKNRYYVPVNNVLDKINVNYTIKQGKAHVENGDKNIDIDKNLANISGEKYKLRKDVILKEDIMYMSFFDFNKIMGLKANWNESEKTISLYKNKEQKKIENNKNKDSKIKPAFVRLEDITSNQRYKTPEALEKLRVISDYLYSKKIPFHVAWVPRYLDPKNNIDDDASRDFNIHNANFVYTLDYFIDRGGIIGLHGYTHQSGAEVSIDGIEFDETRNNDESIIRERVQKAIQCAKVLDIPVEFFESAHYSATNEETKIIEQYFNYMYDPPKFASMGNIAKRKSQGKTVTYIPTPLDYVDGIKHADKVIEKINNLDEGTLGSFFYHPSIESSFIKFKNNKDGSVEYTYEDNSPLKKIVEAFEQNNYEFKKITEI
ncbi:polysaccharide deacetylase family protein [Clostridium sporogenes]|uniref:polysaccharide deacetylase family protein n=1 Tax=Clostridium sporogenes TaxID=1509 RepID=UPI00223763E9|nr:polysaccharide deacetylase family protein [Clostridium sporogenes]MCW6109060.1 polysaccharide deacetylase family protein [Clostridium sporogenes]